MLAKLVKKNKGYSVTMQVGIVLWIKRAATKVKCDSKTQGKKWVVDLLHFTLLAWHR